MVIHSLAEYCRRNESFFNKLHVRCSAKDIGCSLRPFVLDALVIPGGTLVLGVSLAYDFLTVCGVSLSLSLKEYLLLA
jgi:hypothetical protein